MTTVSVYESYNVILLHLIDQKFCSQETTISGNMILCGIINFVNYTKLIIHN